LVLPYIPAFDGISISSLVVLWYEEYRFPYLLGCHFASSALYGGGSRGCRCVKAISVRVFRLGAVNAVAVCVVAVCVVAVGVVAVGVVAVGVVAFGVVAVSVVL
jgi:hypothetical protein